MSRDNISSGELDRIDLIAACTAVEKRILELRGELRQEAVAYHLAPPQGRIARWLGLEPITRTQAEAELLADQGDDLFGPEHTWKHSTQLSLARAIRSLAQASRAATIRVTREDFDSIRFGWVEVMEAKAKAAPKTAQLYPGASCNQCGWVGKRVDTTGDDEACPACGIADTSWLTPEELEKESAE